MKILYFDKGCDQFYMNLFSISAAWLEKTILEVWFLLPVTFGPSFFSTRDYRLLR
jgi:hypothetical protein